MKKQDHRINCNNQARIAPLIRAILIALTLMPRLDVVRAATCPVCTFETAINETQQVKTVLDTGVMLCDSADVTSNYACLENESATRVTGRQYYRGISGAWLPSATTTVDFIIECRNDETMCDELPGGA